MIKTAIIDHSRTFRYLLTRTWDKQKKNVLFIMLNPSTADAEIDDPTIRRCINYAEDWGYGGIEVVNLFAYRATDPKKLYSEPGRTIGKDNNLHILEAADRCELIVAAWGVHGEIMDRGLDVLRLLCKRNIHCLGVTKQQRPKHPLYLRKDLKPVMYLEKEGGCAKRENIGRPTRGGAQMRYGTEANYCALALVIAAREELTPEEACAKMVVPMTGKRKMTDADHDLIKELHDNGTPQREIAGIFGKTERAIQKMIQYRAKRERMEQDAGAESHNPMGALGDTCSNWGKGERDQVLAN